MNQQEQTHDVKSIFGRAFELHDPTERRAYLDDACGDAPSIRSEVEDLLEMHEHAGEFMRRPPAATSVTLGQDTIVEAAGKGIDSYTLREQIGEGGVWSRLRRGTDEPCAAKSGIKSHQTGYGLEGSAGPLQSGAAGAGANGSPQHRAGLRRRDDGLWTTVLCDGIGSRRSACRVLRSEEPRCAGSVSSCSSRSARLSSTPMRKV